MTREEFTAALLGSATAVKAVAEIVPGKPQTKRLLAMEFPERIRPEQRLLIKEQLRPYEEKYGIEFLILHGGLRLVDPGVKRVEDRKA